jgi:ATP-dependent RNA helicase A
MNQSELSKLNIGPYTSVSNSYNNELPYTRGAPASYMAHINQMSNRRLAPQEPEELDMNAKIHGFWTIENAKSRLHEYMQRNKMRAEYKFSATGTDNHKFKNLILSSNLFL